jgi:nucleotide-binding universal stress UspA family protein
MKFVLVATDGSASAGRAVALAAAIAKAFDAVLHIVNVLEGYSPADEALECRPSSVESPSFEAISCAATTILQEARTRASTLGAPRIEIESRTGPVAETILEIAREESADTIVVGKRGHGRVAGLLLGSVSQRIVCEAFCPVIVAP